LGCCIITVIFAYFVKEIIIFLDHRVLSFLFSRHLAN